jgi:hypothetical protein
MQRTSSFLLSAARAGVRCLIISGIVLFLALPAFAGAPLENPSGTFVAYVDYVVPGDAEASEDFKTIYFYDRENNTRYRGSYYPFGLWSPNYPDLGASGLPPDLRLVRWEDDVTVMVEVSIISSGWWSEAGECLAPSAPYSALYSVSITGRTAFAAWTNYPHSDSTRPVQDNNYVWDLLKEATGIDEFCQSLCAGDIPVNREYAPLNLAMEEWNEDADLRDYWEGFGFHLENPEALAERLRTNIGPCVYTAITGITPDPEGRQDIWDVWLFYEPCCGYTIDKFGLKNGHYAIVYTNPWPGE